MSNSQLNPIEVNRNIIEMEYAVRGPIPQRAAELQRQGLKTIPCNIGNPQALGQQSLTYYRQVISLLEEPSKIIRERQLKKLKSDNPQLFEKFSELDFISDYVLDQSENIYAKLETGLGAYTGSKGPLFIREAVARFIDQRDLTDASFGVKSDPENIYLTNGASDGAKYVIEMLISGKNDGIMIPTPQYPLYSATIKKCGGVQVNYYPEEDEGWAFDKNLLVETFQKATKDGVKIKGIVVINPANPTGAILEKQSVRDVIDFARENNLSIIADEVYQENLYGAEFHSFAKTLGSDEVPLFSLHSVSKGFYGECGHRGGYLEVRNAPQIKDSKLNFTDVLLKQASVSLCSNTVGQVMTYLMVSPPDEGSEPYELFIKEKQNILSDLLEKATMIKKAFKQMDGVECFGRIGAMYLFPRLNKLPVGTNDFDYCLELLEKTGLCTVNGSGFCQQEGTHHLRIAFLPPKEMLEEVLPRWVDFHNEYVNM